MGHDINVHREYYRLPQSTLEIAKVSKVLHALNSGTIASIKGKNLDEIDAMEPLEVEQPSDDDDDDQVEDSHTCASVCEDMPSSTATDEPTDSSSETSDSDDDYRVQTKRPPGKKRKNVVKTPWSKEEKDVVENGLKKCLKLKTLPKKLECLELIKQYPILARRSWVMVKGYIRTRILAMQRGHQKANK